MRLQSAFCFLLLWIVLLPVAGLASPRVVPSLRVMSYNIRLDVASDGPNRWDLRKDRVAGLLRYHTPDIVGVQEALPNQLADLAAALPAYSWYGPGRDDGQQRGEASAIFYRTDRFILLSKGTFWLSATPEAPGKGWDAAYPRVCSWVQLRDKASGRTFYHFNTHLDHVGATARREGTALILARMQQVAGSAPVLLTGDFNTAPASEPYQLIQNSGRLQDTELLTQTPHYGPEGTWATFEVAHGLGDRIDYVFASAPFSVLQHAHLTDSEKQFYLSDHLPVLAELAWPGK
ncbi:endonuclease/exonuclease/phosphatase family protein [Hymenobacter metallilatus]|uniref:Endonuclease/exonuclease/phosphatase family protein n=1 Tax=Hymenobacter metallilatus TaxID=2493666 RepID=A0A428JLY4_9BACT|nr:endonuclease/exonuclease/phosphatase family protein [Hymenobacter metallilatus]RSK34017.1 endonuclease/exonuclease/phosphatase family protein [Hymenobacter metallilatus]